MLTNEPSIIIIGGGSWGAVVLATEAGPLAVKVVVAVTPRTARIANERPILRM